MKKKVSKKLALKKLTLAKLQLTNPEAIKGGGVLTSSIWICDGCGGNTTISCGGAGYPCN
ncbi:class I lanthipeptide [Chitinophaga solisilvae]|uniref:Uncharacterized protein n=1 Tax=Chitinophaga solisilvae TaxID=1233460 RepID=A0A433W904_9BACT|nr:class I lanthipeptide [Chitinophaga solisilvae]NSL87866.1 hypothetical protein [Chitinophaga solisilvae]NSL91243.1 hypothetical protein [Chitinophaga solisilvae]